jgi:glycosyltransferase involved in cell wall biosynthesis
MHILHVLPKLGVGGIETSLVAFLKHALVVYPDLQHTVVASRGALCSALPAKVAYTPMNLHRKNPLSLFWNGWCLGRLSRERCIDLVHAQSRGPCWSALFAHWLTGISFVTSVHGCHKIQNFLKRFCNSSELRGNVVMPVSSFLARHIKESYPPFKGRTVVTPMGVDVSHFDPKQVPQDLSWRARYSRNNEPIFLMPGQFTERKGHTVLMEALRLLIKQEPFQCVFVGPFAGFQDRITALKKYRCELGLEEYVHFEDAPPDLRILMRMADIVVTPSIRPEAFGLVAAEACALECCVIASDCGGFQEIIKDKETGWLFRPSCVVSLAETLRCVLRLPMEVRQRISQQARQHICKHFSLDQYAQGVVGVYHSLSTQRLKHVDFNH